ncbi:hypothetical protein OJF2_73580 [Aquisphaera giovannonii]|uniref:Uncharacterized protein n=1 Tax=Aquisphaera giovannonii TaxID=406548 RepID=A0A5B9WDU7_9BACT|nr:hypothetical protein OJF2_73580 [Aquisphaera giovannonii]
MNPSHELRHAGPRDAAAVRPGRPAEAIVPVRPPRRRPECGPGDTAGRKVRSPAGQPAPPHLRAAGATGWGVLRARARAGMVEEVAEVLEAVRRRRPAGGVRYGRDDEVWVREVRPAAQDASRTQWPSTAGGVPRHATLIRSRPSSDRGGCWHRGGPSPMMPLAAQRPHRRSSGRVARRGRPTSPRARRPSHRRVGSAGRPGGPGGEGPLVPVVRGQRWRSHAGRVRPTARAVAPFNRSHRRPHAAGRGGRPAGPSRRRQWPVGSRPTNWNRLLWSIA